MDLEFSRRRRLYFEELETKISPGAFLAGAGLLGLGLPGLGQAAETASIEAQSLPGPRSEQAVTERIGTARDTERNDLAKLLPVSAPQTHIIRTAVSSEAHSSSEARIVPAPRPSSLLASLFASAPEHSPVADAPISTSTTLPDRTSHAGSGAGGGGGGSAGGGAAGSGSARTRFPSSFGSGNATTPVSTGSRTGAAQSQEATAAALAALGLTDANQAACGNNADTATPQPASQLQLVDSAGNPFSLTLDANTLVIGAATWCPHCAQLESVLSQPDVRSALSGLRIIFVFGDEGGTGPGGVQNPSVLAQLPGEAAFLAPGSIRPAAFPNAFDAASGQFNADPYDAIIAWYTARIGQAVPDTGGAQAQIRQAQPDLPTNGPSSGIANGASVTIPGDYNGDFHVDSADYVLWRDTLGQTGANLAADGSGNGVVDQADYDIWRENFGNVLDKPGAFSITGPNSTETQTVAMITWSTSENATSYHVVISKNVDLSDPAVDQTVGTTSIQVQLLSGDHYVGVTAINAAGLTLANNEPFAFNTILPFDQLIFATSTQYTVDPSGTYPPGGNSFGSVAAADYQCTSIANAAGLLNQPWDGNTLFFKAVITLPLTDITTRADLGENGYFNTVGDLVATDIDGFLSGNWNAPVLSETGATLSGTQYAWTGASATGDPSSNANSWTDPNSTANVGDINGTGGQKFDAATISASGTARLYCVGGY
ncbi:MAG TPA: hypothetical protein VH107_04475, partial [Lacipirellulaceae bacterium]|nr:hypothetical protein [Lacipirellulaceae bacterium]